MAITAARLVGPVARRFLPGRRRRRAGGFLADGHQRGELCYHSLIGAEIDTAILKKRERIASGSVRAAHRYCPIVSHRDRNGASRGEVFRFLLELSDELPVNGYEASC